ncbi:serine hydrolase [Proteiniborus sp. MB09-C3]|uniref:serine hydrolase domain-containing protein n=1 Tax=Proteiniborus sp. MB09-C3 TaxID=3050072 RepID=UPI0025530C42|nr:serine hydrolase [Proteiniborus sp. MB09-C3]WIV12780.1 serine hydrolase [Proteiniborus sp. MB09-C3]
MNQAIFNEMIDRISNENILNLVVIKDGEIVVDYNKQDDYKGKRFKINSCTKSIISTLIGIAIDNKLIEGVHQPISDFFPELRANDIEKRKKDITVYHLLTMTSGISWPEFGNWEFISGLVNSNDWVKFILDMPMEHSPGNVFNYSSGGSHLLSAIISRATGMNAQKYAQKHIFEPLDIKNFIWMSDPQGNSNGGFGIEMSAYDMAKIGCLYMNKGKKGKDSLIPEYWINESLEPKILVSRSLGHYGYQWWIKDLSFKETTHTAYFAMGNGGQFIFVIPSVNMVAVFISDNYDDSFRPIYYMKKYLLRMF